MNNTMSIERTLISKETIGDETMYRLVAQGEDTWMGAFTHWEAIPIKGTMGSNSFHTLTRCTMTPCAQEIHEGHDPTQLIVIEIQEKIPLNLVFRTPEEALATVIEDGVWIEP